MFKRVEEPLTINAEVCANALQRHGYYAMASFIRELGDGVKSANQDARYYAKACQELQQRIRELVPTEKRHDPRPPAEASD